MPPAVAAFTDTYLPTVNGVTYTVSAWRERYEKRGGRMDVVYPSSSYEETDGEYPVPSLPFPFYDGYRLGIPKVPADVRDVEVVHSHTPFTVGIAGYRLARSHDLPFVVSYHTPTSEYASYIAPDQLSGAVARTSDRYESWFLKRADLVLAPSEATAAKIRERLPASVPVHAHPNGVDTQQFQPTDTADFAARYDLPDDRPLVGYTGRHGFEKNLGAIIEAVAELDVTLVFGGGGPATTKLREQATAAGVDARFLGFLNREELPAFYSVLDVFAFPSPVETQGIVALEANSCGTPVVGVDSGALSETVKTGETGYHFRYGDRAGFTEAIERALEERDELSASCLEYREALSLDHSIGTLEEAYEGLI